LQKFLGKLNVLSIVCGVLISLLLTIILKLVIGDFALWILPLVAGLISIFLANETDLLVVGISSLLAGLITFIWVGPLFIILAPAGGCLGALLNGYLSGSPRIDLNKKSTSSGSRIQPLENWFTHPRTNKIIPIIAIIIAGVVLVWGVGLPVNEPVPVNKTTKITNNTTANNTTSSLESEVKKGVTAFFINFNSIFNQDGTSTGYIISTIQIDNLTKVSETQVNVTVSLTRIATTGEQYRSVWSGPFYLENGTWIDKGDFVQTHTYNKTTGEEVF